MLLIVKQKNNFIEFKEEMQSKTSIIVSHRISSIKKADLILYLKEQKLLKWERMKNYWPCKKIIIN